MLDQGHAQTAHTIGATHYDNRRIFFLFQPTGQRNICIRLLEHGCKSHDFRMMSQDAGCGFFDEIFRILLPRGQFIQPAGLGHLNLRRRRAAPRNAFVSHPFNVLGKRA